MAIKYDASGNDASFTGGMSMSITSDKDAKGDDVLDFKGDKVNVSEVNFEFVHDMSTNMIRFGMDDGRSQVVMSKTEFQAVPPMLHAKGVKAIQEFQRNYPTIGADALRAWVTPPGPEKPSYTHRSFGNLEEIGYLEATFKAKDGELVTISTDMLAAVVEALVNSGAITARKAVDLVHVASGHPKPKIPEITVKSSIQFILDDIKAQKNPDAVFLRGGELMRDVTARIMEVTRAAGSDDEDE